MIPYFAYGFGGEKCLCFLPAGVPIARPVAGIAMGLVKREGSDDYRILSDITGTEDALGDMDFKLAGDGLGITALQMDIKVEGVSLAIIEKALSQAGSGMSHILNEMAACSPGPRGSLADHAPKVLSFTIRSDRRAAVIGKGGANIRAIIKASGAEEINVNEEGAVEIIAYTPGAAESARSMIALIVDDPVKGTLLRSVGFFALNSSSLEGKIRADDFPKTLAYM